MKKNILFVTGSLSDGGAEKVMSILASGCAELGNNVTLMVLRDKKIVYPVSDKVNLIHLKEVGRFITIKRIKKLRKIIKATKPDAIIPFLNTISVYSIVANWGLGYDLIFSVRADPNISMDDASLKDRLGRFCMRKLKWNEKAKWTIFQTPDAQACYSQTIQSRSSVIPNPIDTSRLPVRFTGERDKRIVAAGRMSEEKNFPMLLRAFAEFHKSFPEYSLVIYGEGNQRQALEQLVVELRMKEFVSMPGFAANLTEQIVSASMYVSTSNHEGISNSMLEALGMGIPTIVTDCPVGGARMFVKTDENGILIPMEDHDALVAAMIKIASDAEYANTISTNAIKIREQLSAEHICQKWLELI